MIFKILFKGLVSKVRVKTTSKLLSEEVGLPEFLVLENRLFDILEAFRERDKQILKSKEKLSCSWLWIRSESFLKTFLSTQEHLFWNFIWSAYCPEEFEQWSVGYDDLCSFKNLRNYLEYHFIQIAHYSFDIRPLAQSLNLSIKFA